MEGCVNYVVTHRPYPIEQDEMYRKLCVGGYSDDISASELDGKNIAEYNDRLNELTGLYWIWKNTKSGIIGMSHYRRFFDNGGRLDMASAKRILTEDGYDIILSDLLTLGWTLKQNIQMVMGKQLFYDAYGEIARAIARNQPEYEDDFYDVMAGRQMYHKNMFMTRREILNRYCEWLFSFLIEATGRVDVSGKSGYEKRVCGYFGETMWTVWLRKQNLKVYEMPIMRR